MKVIEGKPATIGQTVRAVAAGAAGGAVSGAIGSTCPTCAIAARGAAPTGLLISGITGSMAGGAVTRAVAGTPQTLAAAQSDAIGGAAGVAAGQALVTTGRAIVRPAVDKLFLQGGALRAEAAAANTGLGADKAIQQTIATIQSSVNAAAAAGGEAANSVVATTLPSKREEP